MVEVVEVVCVCMLRLFLMGVSFCRVINAGKSSLNEDQACCEVVVVRRPSTGGCSTPSRTPTAKRRSSLPNGEGLSLREQSVSDPRLTPIIFN